MPVEQLGKLDISLSEKYRRWMDAKNADTLMGNNLLIKAQLEAQAAAPPQSQLTQPQMLTL